MNYNRNRNNKFLNNYKKQRIFTKINGKLITNKEKK